MLDTFFIVNDKLDFYLREEKISGIADWGDEFFVWSRAERGSKQKIHPGIK